ncbi:MAG: hypothetical protein JXQ73_07890 [Phycisphaerae bacterium]|nr:hypothetical protein [Phycisphaerae bacterium]
MRGVCAAVVVCLLVGTAWAEPVLYVFDVTDGSLSIDFIPDEIAVPDPLTGALGGTFAMTIYQSNGHIGESDTFVLEDADLHNTGQLSFTLDNLSRGTIDPGNLTVLDFAPDGPGHIGPGGAATVSSDLFLDASIFVTGLLTTSFSTATWAGTLLPIDLTFTTSVVASNVLTADITAGYAWEVGFSDISATLTLDIMIEATGTAHVVPDPALGGLIAMGLGVGGTWLRRRRA